MCVLTCRDKLSRSSRPKEEMDVMSDFVATFRHLCLSLQRELETISEALRIPGSKSLGPIARVGSGYGAAGPRLSRLQKCRHVLGGWVTET